MTRQTASRFQFVWWGWLDWRLPRVHRWTGGLARIYAYSIVLGPLELRRWRSLAEQRRSEP